MRPRADIGHAQSFAHDRVLHLIDGLHLFQLRILDEQFLAEGLVEGDVNVFVDGCRNDETSMLAVVRGQVGAAAAE